uniref:phosphoethanolamine transferase n=1 Tax=Helicobacter cetorum TaxID=138563 RepID=UPI000CF0653A
IEIPHAIKTAKRYKEGVTSALGTMRYIALAKGVFYFNQSANSLKESAKSSQALENINYSKDYIVKDTSNIKNVVLIFGESENRNFMSVYGYKATTTPYLDALKKQGSLFVFDNVISPAFYTDKSFSMLLTYANRDNLNKKAWYLYKNLAHILKLTDYQNAWITSQDYSIMYGNSYYQVAKHFDTYMQNPKLYDENLIALYKEYRKNERERESKNFIVFHLIGSHFEYKNRFPKEFSHFNIDNTPYFANNKTLLVKNDSDKQIVADYINSIYYNDFVLHSIIEQFKNEDSLVIYLSDHGEDIFMDNHLHMHKCTNAGVEIPFLIYASDIFKQKHPEILENFKNSLHKPFMSDDLLHTLLSLIGIETKDYESTRDLFSKDYNIKRIRKPCHNKTYPMEK